MRWRVPPGLLPGVVLLAVLAGAMIAVRATPGGPMAWVEAGVRAVHRMGPGGVAAFALGQVLIAFSGVLPASLVGIAAGAVYGVPLGFLLASASTMLGAWLAFRASRSLLRSRIEGLLAGRPRLRALDAGLSRESWRLVCLLRVSPVMPFAVTSYMLGLSSVSTRAYVLGNLAALPALLGYVCLGGLAGAGIAADGSGAGRIRCSLLGLGVLATVALTWRVGRILARLTAGDGAEAKSALGSASILVGKGGR